MYRLPFFPVLFSFVFVPAALANIEATYYAARTQAPDLTTLCAGSSTCVVGTENFNTWTGGSFTTNFGTTGSKSISGSYSGGFVPSSANQYGGAGGSGQYPELFGSTYTLSLSTANLPGVNYFGLWFSALDNGNQLKFYQGSNLVYSFTPQDFRTLVGACTGSNPFCGNPNSGLDSHEQFAFLNFFDIGGTFDSVVFTQVGGGGFESDNHTVAYIDPITASGTLITTPEPNAWGLFAVGAFLLARTIRNKRLQLTSERGVEVDTSCIWRWVQAYAPKLNKRCRRI